MAELLTFDQTDSVANYLLREIIGKRETQKFVRMYNSLAIGPEQYHQNVADAAGLTLFEIEVPKKLSQSGCHDGAKIEFHPDKNKLVIYGITTLKLVTPEQIVVDMYLEDFHQLDLQLQSCRSATCRLFETSTKLLASQPGLFSTISDEIEDAELFQS